MEFCQIVDTATYCPAGTPAAAATATLDNPQGPLLLESELVPPSCQQFPIIPANMAVTALPVLHLALLLVVAVLACSKLVHADDFKYGRATFYDDNGQ